MVRLRSSSVLRRTAFAIAAVEHPATVCAKLLGIQSPSSDCHQLRNAVLLATSCPFLLRYIANGFDQDCGGGVCSVAHFVVLLDKLTRESLDYLLQSVARLAAVVPASYLIDKTTCYLHLLALSLFVITNRPSPYSIIGSPGVNS